MTSNALTIIGWGNQAKAWAKNLKDSDWNVTIALRQNSPSWSQAVSQGFKVEQLDFSLKRKSTFALLIPDHKIHEMLQFYRDVIPHGSRLIYAHGFAYVAHKLEKEFPHLDHYLLAPKAIASELRKQYLENGFLGAAYSIEHSKNPEEAAVFVKSLSRALGINAGPFPCSAELEMKADLLSEQALLCSLLPMGAKTSFDLLVKNGVPEEIAYLECWQEMSLIAKTMVEKGPMAFFDMISPNALIGGNKGARELFNSDYHQRLEGLWNDIEHGHFVNEASSIDEMEEKALTRQRWKNERLQKVHERLTAQGDC